MYLIVRRREDECDLNNNMLSLECKNTKKKERKKKKKNTNSGFKTRHERCGSMMHMRIILIEKLQKH